MTSHPPKHVETQADSELQTQLEASPPPEQIGILGFLEPSKAPRMKPGLPGGFSAVGTTGVGICPAVGSTQFDIPCHPSPVPSPGNEWPGRVGSEFCEVGPPYTTTPILARAAEPTGRRVPESHLPPLQSSCLLSPNHRCPLGSSCWSFVWCGRDHGGLDHREGKLLVHIQTALSHLDLSFLEEQKAEVAAR